MLRKYELDSSHVISFDDIEPDEDATYIEKLVRIPTYEERKLRTKVILMVKVIWRQDGTKEEVTWEIEREMQSHYPYLFED